MRELFGIMAVFDTPEAVREAAVKVRNAGFRSFEAYAPFPVEGLDELVDPGRKIFLPLLMFVAAILGAVWGYWIQFWDEAVDYPINVGGRPHNSWPAFVVSTFEFMLLVAIVAGFVGMLVASRLPKLYHPLFNAPGFARASRDRFVICIEASDPRFDAASVHRVFEQLGAQQIEEIRG